MPCMKNKVIFVVIGSRKLVHCDFVSRGQTVNQEFYLTNVGSLQEAVRNKRLNLHRQQLLFRDVLDRDLATLFRRYSQKTKVPCGSASTQQPSSLQSRFCFLLPTLKFSIKGRRFLSIEERKANTLE